MSEEKEYCCKDCGSEEIMWSAYIDERKYIMGLKVKEKANEQ